MQISHNYTHITSLLTLPPLPPSHPSKSEHQSGLPVSYSILYMSMLLSPFIPLFPSPIVSTGLLSVSVSPFLPCKQTDQHSIIELIYCIYFSSFDLLRPVQQVPVSPTSLELTQIHSFLWLSNIPLYICTTSLSIHLLMDI